MQLTFCITIFNTYIILNVWKHVWRKVSGTHQTAMYTCRKYEIGVCKMQSVGKQYQ